DEYPVSPSTGGAARPATAGEELINGDDQPHGDGRGRRPAHARPRLAPALEREPLVPVLRSGERGRRRAPRGHPCEPRRGEPLPLRHPPREGGAQPDRPSTSGTARRARPSRPRRPLYRMGRAARALSAALPAREPWDGRRLAGNQPDVRVSPPAGRELRSVPG